MKKIVPKIELLPNYLWHIYAIANLWSKDKLDYSIIHKSMMSVENRDFLHENRELLVWGNGRGGRFTGLLFFIPLKLEFMDFAEYLSFLDSLFNSIKSRNWVMFKEKYDFHYDMSKIVFSKEEIDFLESYNGIMKRNHSEYLNKLWPVHKVRLKETADFITGYFEEKRAIEKWEEFLNKQFPADELNIVLTVANKSLPSANNLSRTRYNFYYKPDSKEDLCKFILHEIGTNLLSEDLHINYKDEELQTKVINENNLVWMAFEALAEYSKSIIFETEKAVWSGEMFGGGMFRFSEFYEFYNTYNWDKSNLNYATVMKEAVLFVADKI